MTDNRKKYNSYLELINSALDAYLSIENPGFQIVADAMKYSVENGGKRIRPVLVLEFCRVCGGNIADAMPFACALEMIHTYSLIHDDLPCMDDDDYRRGRESCHKKFGYPYALLAGDGLLTYAFQIAGNSGVSPEVAIQCVRLLSEYAGICGMIGGQTMDISNEGNIQISLETLKTTHMLKTGALIKCACEMGCIIAHADEKQMQAAKAFAENLGLAFQITDDILDVTGDPEILGKEVGQDAENNKVTYVTLLNIDGAKELAKQYTDNALKALEDFDDTDMLKALVEKILQREK